MVDLIEEKCLQGIHLGNILTIFEANSKSHNFVEVQNKCMMVLKTDPLGVFEKEEIKNISVKNMEFLLNQRYTKCTSYDLFDLLRFWKQKEGNKATSTMKKIIREALNNKIIDRIIIFGEKRKTIVEVDGNCLYVQLKAITTVRLVLGHKHRAGRIPFYVGIIR